jgi:hypothetical protein
MLSIVLTPFRFFQTYGAEGKSANAPQLQMFTSTGIAGHDAVHFLSFGDKSLIGLLYATFLPFASP